MGRFPSCEHFVCLRYRIPIPRLFSHIGGTKSTAVPADRLACWQGTALRRWRVNQHAGDRYSGGSHHATRTVITRVAHLLRPPPGMRNRCPAGRVGRFRPAGHPPTCSRARRRRPPDRGRRCALAVDGAPGAAATAQAGWRRAGGPGAGATLLHGHGLRLAPLFTTASLASGLPSWSPCAQPGARAPGLPVRALLRTTLARPPGHRRGAGSRLQRARPDPRCGASGSRAQRRGCGALRRGRCPAAGTTRQAGVWRGISGGAVLARHVAGEGRSELPGSRRAGAHSRGTSSGRRRAAALPCAYQVAFLGLEDGRRCWAGATTRRRSWQPPTCCACRRAKG